MKKGNKIFLICILIILCLSSLSMFLIYHKKLSHTTAQVSLYGKVIKTFDLDSIKEPIEFDIDNKNGGVNTVRVESGRIGIIHANCPDQLCCKRGFISDSLLPSVCLPNGVVIEIISDKPSPHSIDTLAE